MLSVNLSSRRFSTALVAILLATTSSPASAAPPQPPSDSITWSGKGVIWDGSDGTLAQEHCDAERTPELTFVLSASQATAAWITLPGSDTPTPMVKANGTKKGFSTFKLTWEAPGPITLSAEGEVPTVDGDTVTATMENPTHKATFTIGSGCLAAPISGVGDPGPGGGTIFYYSATPFTSTGSTCGTACHYLEVAPAGWAPLATWPNDVTVDGQIIAARTNANIDPTLVLSDGPLIFQTDAAGTAIGTGRTNTVQLQAKTVTAGKPARFAFEAALGYAASDSSAGQWFLPSKDELNELCKFARGQTAALGTSAECDSSGTDNTTLGLTANYVYWSSTFGLFTSGSIVGQGSGYCFTTGCPNPGNIPGSLYNGYYREYGQLVRPIRAF